MNELHRPEADAWTHRNPLRELGHSLYITGPRGTSLLPAGFVKRGTPRPLPASLLAGLLHPQPLLTCPAAEAAGYLYQANSKLAERTPPACWKQASHFVAREFTRRATLNNG
jgi:hypothetical protein